jgi:hypothetical protein
MESKAHLSEVHAELNNWVKELIFYKDEVKVFQSRLEEVVKQNNRTDILAEVEHFQNQFIRQHEVIDTLKHDFKKVDNTIAANIQNNPVASDHRTMEFPPELIDQHETFLKIYNELKAEFEKFLARTY